MRRHELRDEQWICIQALIPTGLGRPRVLSDRTFINASLVPGPAATMVHFRGQVVNGFGKRAVVVSGRQRGRCAPGEEWRDSEGTCVGGCPDGEQMYMGFVNDETDDLGNLGCVSEICEIGEMPFIEPPEGFDYHYLDYDEIIDLQSGKFHCISDSECLDDGVYSKAHGCE